MGPLPKQQGLRALALVLAIVGPSRQAASEPPVVPSAVAERVARGDVQGALTEIDALSATGRGRTDGATWQGRVEVGYLRARLLAKLGRLDEALSVLPRADAPLPEPVRAELGTLRALWLARLGRCAQALPLLAELEARGATADALRAAECALANGDPAGALARFERTATSGRWVDAVAVGLMHAEALTRLGRGGDAATLLRRLYLERPEHPASPQVLDALRAAGGSDALSLDDRIARAERFMQVRAAQRALDELDAIRAPRERAARARYLHARGMALYALRTRYAEAARVLGQAARLGGATALDDAFHSARALSRADQDTGAIAAYRKLAREHAATARGAEADYLAAWLELRAGRARGARELTRILQSPATPLARRRAARFELGMYQLDRRNFDAARASFAESATPGSGAMVEGRGSYWAARAAELGAHPVEAELLYRRVLAVEPLHWYALLARQRLLGLGKEVPEPFAAAPAVQAVSSELPALALPEEPAFFAALGLNEDARDALQRAEAAHMQRAPPGRGLEALVRAYHALGEHARPLALVGRQHPEAWLLRPAGANSWLWEASYPRPHASLVASLEQSEQLPVGYLHAIMRKESSFDPHVVSYADAIGLMQILPATARGVGERLGLEVEREDLFDPELNLRLSARFNAELLRGLGGEPVLAIAAYNAGAHRVRPWLAREARNGEVELDRFVERIPIEQTRNYVRRVVTNWARYLYLAAAEPRGWPLTLPLTFDAPPRLNAETAP